MGFNQCHAYFSKNVDNCKNQLLGDKIHLTIQDFKCSRKCSTVPVPFKVPSLSLISFATRILFHPNSLG